MDERHRARPRGPPHPHQRGGLRPLPLGHEGRAGRGVEGPDGTGPGLQRRQGRLPRRSREGALREQARVVRAGLRPHARRRARVRLEPEVREHRPSLEGRLHHPLRVPREDQGGLRRLAGAAEPPSRSLFPREGRGGRGRLAEGDLGGRPRGRLGAGVHDGPQLLRRLPLRAPPGEPPPGPARLFRRAPVRARRPPPRRVLPHELDGARGIDGVVDVRRLTPAGRRTGP